MEYGSESPLSPPVRFERNGHEVVDQVKSVEVANPDPKSALSFL